MKKVLFLLIFPIFINGQSLQFTKWEVDLNNLNVPFGPYFYLFENDSVKTSNDGISPYVFNKTLYNDSLNHITLIDLDSSSTNHCQHAGKYTYQISNDSLIFNKIEDSCNMRALIFLEGNWISLNTGFQDKYQPFTLKTFPNPTKEDITIKINNFSGNINNEVYDLIGNKLQTTNETTISLRDYSKGIYILKIAYGDSVEEVKVIKD
ncbi:T9SS type A sorting domain-containing protein [Bacteroidota bacterium]|nr:T9SS type A sorting domain-containing protein [Bacteroidota bacterium]|tara:strand:+ start:690 stop:1310 length:621 start_codon:yes stop_codon:yes gene_type:complete